MKGFINVNAYIYGKGIEKTNVGFDGDKIAYIGNENVIDEPISFESDLILCPGFIDQHIHGAGGADTMDASLDALSTIATFLAKEGTTSFLPTTMTQSEENIIKALKNVNDYKAKNFTEGARVLGAHLEGPFISKKHVGAQPIEYVVCPSEKTFSKYEKASNDNVKIVSLAVEEQSATDFVSYLNKKNIVASVGHSDATYNDILNAIKVGLKGVTHTFNAQKPLHHREVGVVGSALLFDDLYSEAICDTIHLSIPAIKLLIKNKPHDKLTLITDSMRAKGLPDGISELGGQKVIVKNGEARLSDGTLAGSVLKMNIALKNLVNLCGVSFTDAVDFATANPAKNLNLFDTIGSIKVGKKADFTLINKDFNVYLTIRDGKIIYKK